MNNRINNNDDTNYLSIRPTFLSQFNNQTARHWTTNIGRRAGIAASIAHGGRVNNQRTIRHSSAWPSDHVRINWVTWQDEFFIRFRTEIRGRGRRASTTTPIARNIGNRSSEWVNGRKSCRQKKLCRQCGMYYSTSKRTYLCTLGTNKIIIIFVFQSLL